MAFLVAFAVPDVTLRLGLRPADVFGRLAFWQPLTYMFLHGGLSHILFNMLGLWMFGVELERMWGTTYFARYYAVCGIGAAITTLLASLLPGSIGEMLYYSLTIGASGAVYGLLLAYAFYYPDRPIYFWMLFPIPAKYFVLIVGGISLFLSMSEAGGVAHTTHLGGIVAGYLYLKGGRMRPLAEITYRYQRWKIDRHRRKFDVYPGGRSAGPTSRIH